MKKDKPNNILPLKIAVCDDILACVIELKDELKRIGYEKEVDGYTSMQEFFQAIKEEKKYDVVFMDVHWSSYNQTGIDFAAALYLRCPSMKIIYVTGQPQEYAQHIFLTQSNLSGFLIKPINQELLMNYLHKICVEIEEEQKNQIIIRNQGKTLCVPVNQIRYFESEGHKVKIHSANQVIVCYGRLTEFLQQLNTQFIQCHKSYLVNMKEVMRMENHSFILKDGTEIPISKSQYNNTKKTFFNYLVEDV